MEVQMSKMQKTKKGVAAIYVVVFTTMLIGIITLSFLRIMLSESGRTLNDTLSDSAYNAALAGVEDAKYVISQYEKRVADNIKDAFVTTVEEANDTNCDIISDAMATTDTPSPYDSETKETNIGSGESFQDQAYTCVTINLSGNFKGTLSQNNPTLVVPLKPKKTSVDDIAGVNITWYMNETKDSTGAVNVFNGNAVQDLNGSGLNNYVNNEDAIKTPSNNGILGAKGVVAADSDNGQPTALNGMRVMLVQSPSGVPNPDYYAAGGETTNRGTLMLLASTTGTDTINKKQFAASADKTLNAPIPVSCNSESCHVSIDFPSPKGGSHRNPDNFFLVLNQLYADPGITVEVDMYKNNPESTIVPFFNVQPIVDATGRSGDLFRRVEARIGTDNGASLIPTAELSSNAPIDKSFFVTKNCINGASECKNK